MNRVLASFFLVIITGIKAPRRRLRVPRPMIVSFHREGSGIMLEPCDAHRGRVDSKRGSVASREP